MKTKVFLFTLFNLIGIALLAQTRDIEGIVTDDQGNPIENVVVSARGTDLSTKTDVNGHYKLSSIPDTIISITLEHPDMEESSASIGLYDKIDVRMSALGSQGISELSLEDLLNMEVVTASKSAEKQSDAPGIISVITKDELKRYGGTTLTDILNRVPGLIRHTTNWTNRTTMAIRGDQIKLNSAHVLILINGRPVREVQEAGISSELFETFPVNIIERIEVIKGPGSVLYGSDAFSGIINIITEKAEENQVSVTGLAGIEGGFGGNGDVTAKINDLSITVGGRYLQKADYRPDYYTTNWFVGDTVYEVDLPEKGYGGYMGLNYKSINYMASYNEWNAGGVSFADEVRARKFFHNLGYNYQINDIWNMDFNVTHTHAELFSEEIVERKCNNIVAEWTNFLKAGNKINIVVGGLYSNSSGTVETLTDPDSTFLVCDGELVSYGFYAQADYRPIKSLKLIAGMQLNKVGDLDLSITPRGGLIWYPIENLSLKVLYSEAFRAPSINELYVNNPGAIYGNEDLKPEKVSTIDVGIGYQAGQLQLGASFFRSQQSDIITYVMDNSFTNRYTNLSDITFIGGEFEGKYYINSDIYVNASFIYQTNENDSVKSLIPISDIGVKAGISYMNDRGITVSVFNIYQGELDDKFDYERSPGLGAYNLMNVHTNFNLNTLFNLNFKPEFSLFFVVDNLLDNEVYLSPGAGSAALPTLPGRRMYIGLNLKLH